MTKSFTLTILGCGASGGVPLSTGYWGNCDRLNPKNYRTRMSLAVKTPRQSWLIDTSPDLRLQATNHHIRRIDGVLYTHYHHDHTGGLEELRSFAYKQKTLIPLWADATTAQALHQRFDYAIEREDGTVCDAHYKPFTRLSLLKNKQPIVIDDIPVIPFAQDHGSCMSMGFHWGTFAYSTDVCALDKETLDLLHGVPFWFVDCTTLIPHSTHAHLEKTLGWIDQVRPERAILIHLGHTIDYDIISAQLPSNVELAYDGMVIQI